VSTVGRTRKTDDRPDDTLVEVRHKDHDDTVSPGIVPLGWLRDFGADNWVEVGEADADQVAALTAADRPGGLTCRSTTVAATRRSTSCPPSRARPRRPSPRSPPAPTSVSASAR
jgi:hypothetical protein